METYFAPAERTDADELREEIASVAENPVLEELLQSVNGLIAVLDEHRQIIALNDSFLRRVGIEDPQALLGLRPGEALGCVHCQEPPGGCGTTKHCSSCGAAIAIVTAISEHKPAEKLCALSTKLDDIPVDLCFLVKASPLRVDGRTFILLFLQDVTLEQLRASLERTFFHDISNMLTGLLGVSQLLSRDPSPALVDVVQQSALRLYKEVEIQKYLFRNDMEDLRVTRENVNAEQLQKELQNVFECHPARDGKVLAYASPPPGLAVTTDASLALRVMSNMLTNALEATADHGTVKAWFEREAGGALAFCVWNDAEIPEPVRGRIFQRSFTTKEGSGRGIGTYAMRLIGERLLGGRVSFTSSGNDGTTFRFCIPALS